VTASSAPACSSPAISSSPAGATGTVRYAVTTSIVAPAARNPSANSGRAIADWGKR